MLKSNVHWYLQLKEIEIKYTDLAFGRQSCLQWVKTLSDKGVAFTRYLKDLPINKIPVLMHCQNVLKYQLQTS